jgi:hypothetical protein
MYEPRAIIPFRSPVRYRSRSLNAYRSAVDDKSDRINPSCRLLGSLNMTLVIRRHPDFVPTVLV